MDKNSKKSTKTLDHWKLLSRCGLLQSRSSHCNEKCADRPISWRLTLFGDRRINMRNNNNNFPAVVGCRRNKLRNAAGLIGLSFFRHEYRIVRIARIGSRRRYKDKFYMQKFSLFSCPPLSASAPLLRLLWRRHCIYCLSDGKGVVVDVPSCSFIPHGNLQITIKITWFKRNNCS